MKDPTIKQRKEKYNQAVALLNDIVKVRIAPSKINGVGVVAMRDLKKGEKLELDAIPHALDLPISYFKKLEPEISDLLLGHWPQIVNGSHFLYPVTKMTAFLNHSDEPNYDAKEDKTIRKIKAGEEITEDYRQIENWHKVFTWLDSKNIV